MCSGESYPDAITECDGDVGKGWKGKDSSIVLPSFSFSESTVRVEVKRV